MQVKQALVLNRVFRHAFHLQSTFPGVICHAFGFCQSWRQLVTAKFEAPPFEQHVANAKAHLEFHKSV